ncbi:nucleoside deaminase [Hyphomonas jannaschiana]|uniref:Cytosine deaminase n=1 Tax=Hyphomonas jannaschiana VP2 TaxID=1280952 RepID=A0A059FDR7_9PROT|nr:nucleoside deaminase [Hyphomonas jannaschiana]KCZ88686.1 Cytosine deaminase [Hyphomonas jannaschiana VP2]
MMRSDADFMKEAYAEAQKGLEEGGLPIGAILVRDGEIIGRGHNQRVQKADPILHGEMACMQNAGRQASYKGTVMYTTLSPCMMCTGTIIQFGVPRVVVGESVNFKGYQDVLALAGIEVKDLHDPACIDMMGDFIRHHPGLWNEDIGK